MIRIAAISLALLALWVGPARAVSSFTQCLTLQQPATGDQTNSWGATVNTNWSIVDNGLAALQSLSLPAQSGYPTVALTFSQGGTDQAKYARFNFTGTLTADTTVLWPNGRCGRFVAQNSTSGAFGTTLCVNNGSGSCAGGSVTLPQGQTAAFYSDGTNVLPETNSVDGNLTVDGNASVAGNASLAGALAVAGTTTLGTALTVPNGGTGDVMLTAHGVLIGEGTSVVAATGVGSAGQVLTSNGAGSDPSFQSNQSNSSIVGSVHNLKIVRASGASLIVAADEIDVEIALGSTVYKGSSLSQTFNATTIGANGMDVGSLPISGFVSIYEIYNSGTATFATLGTTASQTSVYSGANMPTGYIASALIGIWPTNASAQLVVGTQYDREFFYQSDVQVFSGATAPTTFLSQSIAIAVPAGAKTVSGRLGFSSSISAGEVAFGVAADSGGTGVQTGAVTNITSPLGSNYGDFTFRRLPITSAQTVYWAASNPATNSRMTVTAYSF